MMNYAFVETINDSNPYYLFVQAGMTPCHTNKKRSNPLPSGAAVYGSLHIHKTIDRHLSASFRFLHTRIQDTLLLIQG
jgi:hypothetical protein